MVKPEPLKNKTWNCKIDGYALTEKLDRYVFHKEDVKSAIRWYKKYRYNSTIFSEEEPELYTKFLKSKKCIEQSKGRFRSSYPDFIRVFNTWLLNKAFEDVTK